MARLTMTYSQYIQNAGWDYSAIEATARLGASEEDVRVLADLRESGSHLTPEGLVAYCRERVAEHERVSATIAAAQAASGLDEGEAEALAVSETRAQRHRSAR